MSLRLRLIGAFVVLLASLAGLGAWNAWRLWEMGVLSSRIIADNFDSVAAAQQMKDSLERRDPAAFRTAFDRAAHNITEVGEAELIESIRSEHDVGRLREQLDRLQVLNQDAMRRKAAEAGAVSRRSFVTAISLTLVLTVAGLSLAVLMTGSLLRSIRELERLKAAFVAAAAHELRTPLMTFQMGVHLLIEEAGNFTPRQHELLDLCRGESEKLARLSTELLDLSKIESGEAAPRLAHVPPAQLLAGAVEPMRMMIESHAIALTVDAPADLPPAMVDRSQIERVIANLVTNAVRATPSGGSITVSARREGARLAISVADTGHGIPAEYLDKIFVPFIQVPGSPSGGAGLGLPISRRIVEAHGGTLSVESIPGTGSTFRFTLATG